MCGRVKISTRPDREFHPTGHPVRAGVLSPNNTITTVLMNEKVLQWSDKVWGLSLYNYFIYNARLENTRWEHHPRAVVPVNDFLEYNKQTKDFSSFKAEGSSHLWLAAKVVGDKVLIVTIPAYGAVTKVHHRGPLCIEKDKIENWIVAGETQHAYKHVIAA